MKFQDKSFEHEIRSIRIQNYSWYIASFLYFSFFIVQFIIAYDNGFPFKLLILAVLLEEFSYFIPELYIKIVHHRIFKETDSDWVSLSEQGTGTNSKYELLLSLLDSNSDHPASKNS